MDGQAKKNKINKEILCRKDTIVMKDLGQETILYNPVNKMIHILNKTAILIWQLCDGKHSFEDIVASINNKFCLHTDERNKKKVEQDIRSVIDNFAAQGLIE